MGTEVADVNLDREGVEDRLVGGFCLRLGLVAKGDASLIRDDHQVPTQRGMMVQGLGDSCQDLNFIGVIGRAMPKAAVEGAVSIQE
jgi:hypothetical protein